MDKINRQSGDIRRIQIKSAVKDIFFYEGLQKLTTKNIAKNKEITILLFPEASYQNDTDLRKMLSRTYHSLEQSFIQIIRDGITENVSHRFLTTKQLR